MVKFKKVLIEEGNNQLTEKDKKQLESQDQKYYKKKVDDLSECSKSLINKLKDLDQTDLKTFIREITYEFKKNFKDYFSSSKMFSRTNKIIKEMYKNLSKLASGKKDVTVEQFVNCFEFEAKKPDFKGYIKRSAIDNPKIVGLFEELRKAIETKVTEIQEKEAERKAKKEAEVFKILKKAIGKKESQLSKKEMEIVSEYFESEKNEKIKKACKNQGINIEEFKYNPIPLTDKNREFFKNINNTQYVYNNYDKIFDIPNHVISIKGIISTPLGTNNIDNFKNVTIENSVTIIGYKAFYGCSSLKEITIPDSVTSICDEAFYGCTNLKEITIPNSVKSIGDSAFYGCTNLKEITIPNSVKSIGDSAFGDCSSLKEITIPDSVTSIDNRAFEDCSSLKEITIPDSVTSITYRAFADCSNLENVTPKSVIDKFPDAFEGCDKLKK